MKLLIPILVCILLLTACKKDIPKDDISTEHIAVIKDSCSCLLPNAFSPDGNNKNDVLQPVLINVQSANYTFTVRNLRQKIPFTTTTPGEAWTGDDEPKGLYIATVKGTLACGTSFEEHNCVNLIKDCIDNYLDVNKLVFESMLDPITGTPLYPSGEQACN